MRFTALMLSAAVTLAAFSGVASAGAGAPAKGDSNFTILSNLSPQPMSKDEMSTIRGTDLKIFLDGSTMEFDWRPDFHLSVGPECTVDCNFPFTGAH